MEFICLLVSSLFIYILVRRFVTFGR